MCFLLPPAPLQLTTAVSRKTHAGAGDFDIPLPLTGTPGVECRNSAGNHTLVFTTSNTLVSGNASVTTGTGSVSGSPIFVGNTMTVNLTGVTDVQTLTVTLSGVTDSFAQVLPRHGREHRFPYWRHQRRSFYQRRRHHANAQPLRSNRYRNQLPLRREQGRDHQQRRHQRRALALGELSPVGIRSRVFAGE